MVDKIVGGLLVVAGLLLFATPLYLKEILTGIFALAGLVILLKEKPTAIEGTQTLALLGIGALLYVYPTYYITLTGVALLLMAMMKVLVVKECPIPIADKKVSIVLFLFGLAVLSTISPAISMYTAEILELSLIGAGAILIFEEQIFK